ncbi:YozE family protein [Agrilactobacillus fermenti]|uniref:YozE family protein n=1 Tax=Agrilactobacillus fermenti TaxID=2586909 RepID=UPI001E382AFC|nr:YozE family protein [Agrilactobacillus fermenti]MCD2256551.1 YozE family protein [Agrilactobacillus fermenti]
MKRSFYQWLMTQRNPNGKDELAHFANSAFFDQSFPKQSEDYHEISDYLELNGNYLPNMAVFDQAFTEYQALNKL